MKLYKLPLKIGKFLYMIYVKILFTFIAAPLTILFTFSIMLCYWFKILFCVWFWNQKYFDACVNWYFDFLTINNFPGKHEYVDEETNVVDDNTEDDE